MFEGHVLSLNSLPSAKMPAIIDRFLNKSAEKVNYAFGTNRQTHNTQYSSCERGLRKESGRSSRQVGPIHGSTVQHLTAPELKCDHTVCQYTFL
jgi:hypothetical protein